MGNGQSRILRVICSLKNAYVENFLKQKINGLCQLKRTEKGQQNKLKENTRKEITKKKAEIDEVINR